MTDKTLIAWLTLTLISVVTRITPLFAAHWLRTHPWTARIASQLPFMILILLLFHDIETRVSSGHASLLATLTGIAATLLVHQWKRQIILSITAGVITYAAISFIT